MDAAISPTVARELRKSLAKCGECRLRIDLLASTGANMDDEYRELDRIQEQAQKLLDAEATPGKR